MGKYIPEINVFRLAFTETDDEREEGDHTGLSDAQEKNVLSIVARLFLALCSFTPRLKYGRRGE
jgi:hypothetical protein